jgi:hypothetical protein
VFVDGQYKGPVGNSREILVPLDPLRHRMGRRQTRVRVTREGYEHVEATIHLRANEVAETAPIALEKRK